MPPSLRTIVATAVPTIAALFGIFWFRRKKKTPAIEAPKVPKEDYKTEERVIAVNTQQACNSAPRVFVTQPSQATPKEESFDVTEALAKAVAESISETPREEKGESDSEEESVESVVTAIEASNANAAPPSESDIGVIEDACTSSGTNSEVNTPSPCDTVEKQIIVQEAVVQAHAAPVETEHMERVEAQTNMSVISTKETSKSSKPENVKQEVNSLLTNGVHDDEKSQEVHLTNGKLENVVDIIESSPEEDNHSLSWSETIELSENNNTDKDGDEICLDPFKTKDSSSYKKSNPTAKLSPSASKSQGNVSTTSASKYHVPKQSKSSGSINKAQKPESKKSPRSQQNSSSRRDHPNSGYKKGKYSDSPTKGSPKSEVNGDGDGFKLDDEYSDEWGNQAEAMPNGIHSDAHSEISVDSGKASSVSETPSASSPNNLPDFQVFEFDFPTDYCGRLIGKGGKNVNQLKAKTGAEISLKRKPFTMDFQICSVEGTQSQVHSAIDLMKQRFPPRQFPGITWEQLNVIETSPILPPEIMQLSLPEGVSVDVIVSSVVDANHVFVQQPTHPTYSSLERLLYCMNSCYTQDNIVPQLPRPIDAGVICAAPMYQGWFRAQIVSFDDETDECDIKFVDYGGYLRVKSSILRQIRSDFTTLPFQATECYMAHVVPPKDEEGFGPEGAALLESMVQNQLLQAQILTHEEDGVPYIQLYKIQGDKVFFVNRELVNQNVGRWAEMS